MPLVEVFGVEPDVPQGQLIGWQQSIADLVRALPGFRPDDDGEPYVAFVAELVRPLGSDLRAVVSGLPGRELESDRQKLADDLSDFFVVMRQPRPQSVRVIVEAPLADGSAVAKFQRP